MMYTSRVTTAVLGLLLVISGAMASPASSRKLLQNCSGGCASWIGWGVRRTCAACCTGYILQVRGGVLVDTEVVYASICQR
jgi:hypothetical protein